MTSGSLILCESHEPEHYRPTEVRQWLVCPTLWRFEKRWTPRALPWSPAMVIGSAIHAGVAAHFRAVRGEPVLGPVPTAAMVLEHGYVEQDTWTLESLNRLVDKGITLVLKEVHLHPDAKIIAVEQTIAGRHPDLVTSLHDALEVWDWKTSVSLEARWVPDRLDEYMHSWQLLDYAYHCQEYYQRPVTQVSPVLVILGPRPMVKMQPIRVSNERLQQWKRSADVVWTLMASGQTWMNLEACSNKGHFYGKTCPMFQGCHDLLGDETLFSGIYSPVEAKDG